jgi:DNA-binding NarL/FixJ family response regulator
VGNSTCFSPITKDRFSFFPGQTVMKKTNVIIAVRDTDLRLSLDLMLRDEPGLNIVGTATTLESTLALIKAESTTLILLEWYICQHSIEEVLKAIKESDPELKIILLGNRTNQEPLAHHFGADAFMRIGGAPDNLFSTIKDLISLETQKS